MFEVIIYLFESYMQLDQNIEVDAQEITDELLDEGFQRADISKALAWLDHLSGLHEQPDENRAQVEQPTSHRIYSELEQYRLNTACQGYIFYLEQAQILNAYTREIVIDCAMLLEMNELDLHDLKWLILMVLFNDPSSEDEFLQLESMLMDLEDGLIH
jgi:Smg protein